MTQLELSKRLGVGTTSVYNWCNGLKTPRMDKVDAMCDIFHCKRSDLMEENNPTEATHPISMMRKPNNWHNFFMTIQSTRYYLIQHVKSKKKILNL